MLVVAALDSAIHPSDDVAAAIALLAHGRRMVVAHGLGPHVPLLATEPERDVRTYPLDVLETDDHAGTQALLASVLAAAVEDREVATVVTQVIVDVLDPAFRTPAWRIGSRHVARPTPRAIVELPLVESLLGRDVVVVCSGSGIPVVVGADGRTHPVEAVVDEYLAAAVLARQLGAELLAYLTDRVDDPAVTDAAAWFTTTTCGRAVVGTLDDPPG